MSPGGQFSMSPDSRNRPLPGGTTAPTRRRATEQQTDARIPAALGYRRCGWRRVTESPGARTTRIRPSRRSPQALRNRVPRSRQLGRGRGRRPGSVAALAGATTTPCETGRPSWATTTTRLALNVAQSARSRRETYVGQWLPEPVDTREDPALGAERSEALELAVLLLLEKLRPRERAVYVLSEAFDYSYAQVAETLEITETNARQLASRARKFLARARRQARQRRGTPAAVRSVPGGGTGRRSRRLGAASRVGRGQLLGWWGDRRGGA